MATPLEMNTSELEGLLQDVYDLPDRNSEGSSEPDLVIGVVLPQGYFFGSSNIDSMTFSIKSGSVANTYTKLKNQEQVNVFMEHEYWYNNSKFTGIFYPDIVSAMDKHDGSQIVSLDFMVSSSPGFGYTMEHLSLNVHMDGTFGGVWL